MTVAETVDIVAKLELIAIHHILDHMECKQPHYFFTILGEYSWGILTAIPCVLRLCLILLCCQSLQEHTEAASSCFANTENLNGFNPEM